ncbi:MAG: extracellular solute-binding protein [Bacilli bacterium]|nr:extracellular solute-binding protein [Bacilli bacterium]
MKRKVFSFSLLVSIGLLVFGVTGLSACGSAVHAPVIKMEASEINMNIGETKKLGLSIQKGYADYPVRWFSSNENIVYFRNNSVGYVTAVGEGSATVTASVAGAYVDCKINVSDDGGDPNVARFALSPTSVTLSVGDTKQLNYTLTPEGTTVEFTSDNSSVASVSSTGLITAVAAGTSIITGFASNGITKYCTVTVSEGGAGGEDGLDIAVSDNLKYTGSLTVGAPEKQMSFVQSLLQDFNRLTNSSISFRVTQVEEGKGAAQFASAKAAPAIFPYASDQIVDFQNLGALTQLRTENVKWIANNMLADASTAARVGSSVLGYPFTSDNGVVMFYDSSKVSASDIDTFSKLWAKADELELEIDFKLTEGFYAAGALHTYSGGKSLYKLTPTNTGYKSTASFNGAEGLQAIKTAHALLTNNKETLRFGDGAPSTSGILATIVDTSYVQSFKTLMGNKYAVAPLPFVDDAKTTRMGSYLGYKFYGVNATLDTTSKTMAHDVAKFLVSSYAQTKRYETFRNKPTMSSLQALCADEPHIAALNQQIEDNSTVLLTAAGSELWSAASSALQKVNEKAFPANPTDDQFKAVLSELDATLYVTK